MMSRFWIVMMVLTLALPVLAAGPTERVDERPLTDKEIAKLIEVAQAVRADLTRMRAMQGQPGLKSAQDRNDLQQRVNEKMKTFLALAGLTPEQFVRMVDAENGLDNGKIDHEPPQFRALEPAPKR